LATEAISSSITWCCRRCNTQSNKRYRVAHKNKPLSSVIIKSY